MCAIGNDTIKLTKLRDIKHNNMCLDHSTNTNDVKKTSSKSKNRIYQSDASQASGSDSDIESSISSQSKNLKKDSTKRPNNDNDVYPRKQVKHSTSELPPKPNTSSVSSSVTGSKSPLPQGSALQWLMEKAKTIQVAISAIENMPKEYKSKHF
jgi:hypothetical protein